MRFGLDFLIDNIKQISHNILSDNFREDIQWQHSEGQSLNVFNVIEILRFHHRGYKVQNIAVQNANINTGLESISKMASLSEAAVFVKRNLKLLNRKIGFSVQMNVLEKLKGKLKFAFVPIVENLLRLKELLQIFVVPGNAVVHEIEHLIGRHGRKNLKNVNIVEKNFGRENMQGKEVGGDFVVRNVSQNLSKSSMLLHQNSTIWLNGEKFAKKFLNVTAINVRLAGSMVRDFIYITLNISEMGAMRT